MNHRDLCTGTTVTLHQVLDAREERSYMQREMLETLQDEDGALICLTLNIAGPVKVFPYTVLAYETGLLAVRECLMYIEAKLTDFRDIRKDTGYEAFFAVSGQTPQFCKEHLIILEENHPLGRLFDIDVLAWDGTKVSREELGFSRRTCLLCQNPAFLCGRSRTHSAQELVTREIDMIRNFFVKRFSSHTGQLMQKALFYEVNTTPKPGLVDLAHNGAHTDMNHRSFTDSAYALTPYFIEAARKGMEYALVPKGSLTDLFDSLRPLGMKAEEVMKQATGGVNTHKGMVFSGGILCCALGYDMVHRPGAFTQKYSNPADYFPCLQKIIRQMLCHLPDDYKKDTGRPLSHGEALYRKYGVTGIRGEASQGFPVLFDMGFPLFIKLLAHGYSLHQAGSILLLHYIGETEDSNMIIRSDYETASRIRKELKRFLSSSSYEQQLSILPELDAYFIQKNISPGGSADMLALTYFLYFMSILPCRWD